MNAKTIPCVQYRCGECNSSHISLENAKKCCMPKYCRVCGSELSPRWYKNICTVCEEAKCYENAEKITYDEYLNRGGEILVVGGDDYYGDMESLMDSLEDNYMNEENLPTYCYGTVKVRNDVDIEWAIEKALEEAYEDAEFSNTDELIAFVKEWNAKNAPSTYWPDDKTVVLIPWEAKEGNQ